MDKSTSSRSSIVAYCPFPSVKSTCYNNNKKNGTHTSVNAFDADGERGRKKANGVKCVYYKKYAVCEL